MNLFSKLRFIVMFVTAVCVLFLIKLRWPKKKTIYDKVETGYDFLDGGKRTHQMLNCSYSHWFAYGCLLFYGWGNIKRLLYGKDSLFQLGEYYLL